MRLARPGLWSLALTLPLVAFLLANFLLPLGSMLRQSFHEPHVAEALPETVAVLAQWQGVGLPPEAAFAAVARELRAARHSRALSRVARRMEREQAGLRRVVTRSARALQGPVAREALEEADRGASWRTTLVGVDASWGETGTWHAVKAAGETMTAQHFLHAFDLAEDAAGSVALRAAAERVYLPRLAGTLVASLAITLLCLVTGYPLALAIARAPRRLANVLLALVILCLLTSLLVRTTAWIVLLQYRGVLNNLLVAVGLVPDDGRLVLIYNMSGTIIATAHALLPYMVLALYAVMRGVPATHMQAAASLGAKPLQAFIRVYLPLTMPGVGAGSLLVFMLAIGYFVTPALVGEQSGQMISNLIAHHMQISLNWGLAAAIGSTLLATVVVLYILYEKLFGIRHLRLG